jgi:hypothetical protein
MAARSAVEDPSVRWCDEGCRLVVFRLSVSVRLVRGGESPVGSFGCRSLVGLLPRARPAVATRASLPIVASVRAPALRLEVPLLPAPVALCSSLVDAQRGVLARVVVGPSCLLGTDVVDQAGGDVSRSELPVLLAVEEGEVLGERFERLG